MTEPEIKPPSPSAVRASLDECIQEACMAAMDDEGGFSADRLTALAALVDSAASYRAQTLASAMWHASRSQDPGQ
jgi:hypothetical protein